MGIIDTIKKKKPAVKKVAKAPKAEVAAASVSTAPDAKKATAMGVVFRALVTEKAAVMQSTGKYTFMVALGATKNQVKHAINALHGVMPVSVHMVNVQGKRKRYGQGAGRRSDFKKAIITLPKGQSITIHEGV